MHLLFQWIEYTPRLLASCFIASVVGGCGCHGGVSATTDRVRYALGDQVHIQLVNGTSRNLQVPDVSQRVHFFRHVAGGWLAVDDRPPGEKLFEQALQVTILPCSRMPLDVPVVPTLAPGEYRLQFAAAWSTNPFFVEAPRRVPPSPR